SAEPALTPFGRSWIACLEPVAPAAAITHRVSHSGRCRGQWTQHFRTEHEMLTAGQNGCEKEQHSIIPTSKLVMLYCTGGAKGAATQP
ncbi:Hypothetical predicted protein, partial [Pelobates cultripes]